MKESMINSFIKYVSIDTQSDPKSQQVPSTMKQFDLAKILVSELLDLNVEVDFDEKNCIIYAMIRANTSCNKTVGFISHMDTAPDLSGKNVVPQVIDIYDGQPIKLNDKYILDPKNFNSLNAYIGKTLITTSGDTLLGSDDKSGITIIMQMIRNLKNDINIKHGNIAIAFTPDEEIGMGTINFDIKRFGADFAYTIDGGKQGELQYENFNAASVLITIFGRNVHPGNAKDKLINASELAIKLHNNLPPQMKPQYTDGYEGFFHLTNITGTPEKATLEYIIRDHDENRYNEKIKLINSLHQLLIEPYAVSSNIKVQKQYINMEKLVKTKMYTVDLAKKAMQNCNINPIISPIRGGTDGAMLSEKGLVCPNIFTGGHNFHGRYEYVCVDSMIKAVETITEITKLAVFLK